MLYLSSETSTKRVKKNTKGELKKSGSIVSKATFIIEKNRNDRKSHTPIEWNRSQWTEMPVIFYPANLPNKPSPEFSSLFMGPKHIDAGYF